MRTIRPVPTCLIMCLALVCALSALPTAARAVQVSYDQAVLADSPTAYWRYEDANIGAGAADSAPISGAQNGTFMGNASLTSAGLFGQGVAVTNAGPSGGWVEALVPVTNNITVEAWIKSATPNWSAFGWGPNAREPNGFILHPSNTGTSWQGYILNNAGAFTQIGNHVPTTIDDTYHHYVISFDDASNIGRMYFDGVPFVTNGGLGGVTRDLADTVNVLVGRDGAGTTPDRRGNGTFDEVAIYGGALTPDRVKRHYMIANGANQFAGAADLDFSGKFDYAINIGNTSGSVVATIGDATFTGEAVPGLTINSSNIIFPMWGPKPEYGASAEDNALENIMHSIRYQGPDNGAVTIDLAVTPGRDYKLQLLFSENGFTTPNNRAWDLEIEGATVINEFEVLAVTGGWAGNPTLGTVYTLEFKAQDAALNIRLLAGSSLANNDPIINALTLEDTTPIPEPATAAMLMMLGAAGLWRRRRRVA